MNVEIPKRNFFERGEEPIGGGSLLIIWQLNLA